MGSFQGRRWSLAKLLSRALVWSGRRRGSRRGLRRRRCRFGCGRCGRVSNCDMGDLHWPEGTVVARVSSHARDLFDEGHGGFVTLTENGVAPVEMRHSYLGDEELRAVRVRAGVRVSQASGLVEQEIRRHLILECVARIARPIAFGIAALNHELRNDAVKNRAVVERLAVL